MYIRLVTHHQQTSTQTNLLKTGTKYGLKKCGKWLHRQIATGKFPSLFLNVKFYPVDEVTTRRGIDNPVHHLEKPTGSTYSSTSDLLPTTAHAPRGEC